MNKIAINSLKNKKIIRGSTMSRNRESERRKEERRKSEIPVAVERRRNDRRSGNERRKHWSVDENK